EVERQTAVALPDLAMRHPLRLEMPLPPSEAVFAGDAKPCANDAVSATALRSDRPFEEGHVRSGRALAVGVEEVVGAGVVLVHRLLDEPQAQRLRVESAIARRVRSDCREMMNT